MMYTHAGVAYTSGVYSLRRGTDGHLNPAVTIALTVLQRLTVTRCVSFVCAQFLGQCSQNTLTYLIYTVSGKRCHFIFACNSAKC